MNIFFGCSSHSDIDDKYIKEASIISKEVSNLSYNLVIGGYSKDGMFSSILNNFKDKKVSLYTLKLYNEEILDKNIEVHYVESTFDRTKSIYNATDVLVFLPGGSGTLSEIFSMLEEARTIKDKYIIIYNYDAYYNTLIKSLAFLINNKFNDESLFNYIKVFNTRVDLLSYLESING